MLSDGAGDPSWMALQRRSNIHLVDTFGTARRPECALDAPLSTDSRPGAVALGAIKAGAGQRVQRLVHESGLPLVARNLICEAAAEAMVLRQISVRTPLLDNLTFERPGP